MTLQKPKPTKSVCDMTPEEREVETVRRYQEAIETSKSGVLKKKGTPRPEPESNAGSDETIAGS